MRVPASAVLALVLLTGAVHAADIGRLLARSRAAESRGDMQAAIRFAQSAIVANPARAASYVALGDLYAGSGETDFARFYYEEALGVDPQQKDALRALGRVDPAKP